MTSGEDKYWTKLGLNHFSMFYLVTLLLDKRGTKLGHQSWICPLFVQAPYSCYNFLYFTLQLEGHESWICPIFVQAPYSFYKYVYFTLQLDKSGTILGPISMYFMVFYCWTKVGQEALLCPRYVLTQLGHLSSFVNFFFWPNFVHQMPNPYFCLSPIFNLGPPLCCSTPFPFLSPSCFTSTQDGWMIHMSTR